MHEMIRDSEILASYNVDVLGIQGGFEGVYRPLSKVDIIEIIRECISSKMPLTAQGLRSSLTGAAISESGCALSLEKMNRLIDVDVKQKRAVVEPGMVVSEFKRAVEAEGLMYPPDPTSEADSTIGGNVATNASGARSLTYGSTMDWVRGVEVVAGQGKCLNISDCPAEKICAGYGALYRPTRLWCGSEGTLGIVTRIEVALAPLIENIFVAIVFFSELKSALDFVLQSHQNGRYKPLSMEFLDDACMDMIRPEAGGVNFPENAKAMIYVEQAYADDLQKDTYLNQWFALIEEHTPYWNDTQVAFTEKQKKHLRNLRHHVPEKTNQESIQAARTGGCKISTDWAVPVPRLHELFAYFEKIREPLSGMRVTCYGHIGSGHPHFNFIARNPKEVAAAERIDDLMAQKAVQLGGCVSAEHGIGKLKRRQMAFQYSQPVISAMKALKKEMDPHGILAPGNIFPLR